MKYKINNIIFANSYQHFQHYQDNFFYEIQNHKRWLSVPVAIVESIGEKVGGSEAHKKRLEYYKRDLGI